MGGIYQLRSIMPKPPLERIKICKGILQNESDASLRVEALWILADTLPGISEDDPVREDVADSLESVLVADKSDVVKHEACYLIGENNLRTKIPILQNSALRDPSALVRHEAIEALGLLQEFGSIEVLKKATLDSDSAVNQTAEIVLKQLQRAQENQSLRHQK